MLQTLPLCPAEYPPPDYPRAAEPAGSPHADTSGRFTDCRGSRQQPKWSRCLGRVRSTGDQPRHVKVLLPKALQFVAILTKGL